MVAVEPGPARPRVRIRPRLSLVPLAVVACAAAVPVLLTAGPASAHASLVAMSPADGARVAQPPTQVRLMFSEPVQGRFASVAVTAPGGQRVDRGSPQVVDATVTEMLAPLPAAGRYTVAYRVVSADGHPVSQQLSFTFAPPAGWTPSPAANPAASPAGGPPGAATHASEEGGGGLGGWLRAHSVHLMGGLVVVVVGVVVVVADRRRAR
jgi:copper resistance protein C